MVKREASARRRHGAVPDSGVAMDAGLSPDTWMLRAPGGEPSRGVQPRVREESEPPTVAPAGALASEADSAGAHGALRDDIQGVLTTGGRALAAGTRADMEPRFGHDFGQVRIFADDQAAASAHALQSRAYTLGPNIVFGAGQYAPDEGDGRRLLAHELAHVVQQAGGPTTGAGMTTGRTTLPGDLSIGDPSDASEQAADRAAVEVVTGPRANTPALRGADTSAAIRRKPTEVPLHMTGGGLGVGGRIHDSSSATFTPYGMLIPEARAPKGVGGMSNGLILATSRTDFPTGSAGDVEISAGTSAIVRIAMFLHIFEDNVWRNDELDQQFFVDWKVSADRNGKLAIDANAEVNQDEPTADNLKAGLSSVNPIAGADYVRVSPVIATAGGSVGVTLGIGVTTNAPGQSVTRPFTLHIRVKDIPPPQGQVVVGPISALKNHEVQFPAPDHGRGQDAVSSAQERDLIGWYQGLNDRTKEKIREGSSPISLEGHASTTGDISMNRELSDRRMEHVKRILTQFAGNRAVFEYRAAGKYEAKTPDEVESQDERKVVVSVQEQIFEGERPLPDISP